MLYKALARLGILFLLCLLSYLVGFEKGKSRSITKEVEVIKYVQQEKAKIYAKPNATRSELLELFHNNQL